MVSSEWTSLERLFPWHIYCCDFISPRKGQVAWDKRPKRPVQAFCLARESHDFEALFSGSHCLSIFEASSMELMLKSKIKLWADLHARSSMWKVTLMSLFDSRIVRTPNVQSLCECCHGSMILLKGAGDDTWPGKLALLAVQDVGTMVCFRMWSMPDWQNMFLKYVFHTQVWAHLACNVWTSLLQCTLQFPI